VETLDFGEPRQNGFDYPMPLVEKYQPRKIEDFIGLEGPKRLFASLLKAPRPLAVLLVGPPGCGKTTLGMAFADELPGTLHHISSQRCDVTALGHLNDLCQYYPSQGKFHVVLVDEADQMTERAQLQLLSRLDGTASLKPKFGGGRERGRALPIIWIFTCNGRGEDGTMPPTTLEPRFLSRCLVAACGKPEVAEITSFLRCIWSLEGGNTSDDLSHLAEGCDGLRDALTKLEVALCTGILPSRSVERERPSGKTDCSGKVRYLAPGQPEPDPREWQFRKLSKKGSRVYVRSCALDS
jgi:hypothetical protein